MAFSAALGRMRRPLVCVPLVCTLAAVPTAALARSPRGGSGGIGVTGGSGGSTTPSSPSPTPGVVRLGGVLNASGGGISFNVAAAGTLGRPLTISGSAPTGNAGSSIVIESAKPGGTTWTQAATAVVAANGGFTAQWTPATSARVALRAVLAPAGTTTTSGGSTGLPGGSASAASDEPATAALTIPIFRDAIATLYGPGLWGHHTACGERLTRATLGVASRTLKCGTQVSVFYKGRELTVPVIDRGPFGNNASWDLTMATAKALGITETATIGTIATAPTLAAGA